MFNIQKVEKIIDVRFKNKELLKRAFIHRSFLNEGHNNKIPSNERLEFLGDAILEFWVSKTIFNQFLHYPEGQLTNFRSQVVNTQSLAGISQKLNLGSFLFLSQGEEKEGGRSNTSLLADTFEALVGAIFQDQGLEAVKKFLTKQISPRIQEVTQKDTLKDFKSLLQEEVQKRKGVTPNYQLRKSYGPDHSKIFYFNVYAGKDKIGQGKGQSKQIAQQEAAKKALEKIKQLESNGQA